MPEFRIGILGATGQAGRVIAKFLMTENLGKVVLMGRNPEKLNSLNKTLGGNAEVSVVDIADKNSLESALNGIDFLVIAISSVNLLPMVVDAIIAKKIDAIDILLGSDDKRKLLESKHADFEKSGICYITDGGYHPGVPAAMARWAEQLCQKLISAEIFGSFGVDWKNKDIAEATKEDFVHELKNMDMSVLQNGNWFKSWNNMRKYDFSDGRGAQNCVAMGMDEIRLLPQYISTIKNAGFYIAGFGYMVDMLIMPLCYILLSLFPCALKPIAQLLFWGMKKFASKSNWAKMILEGKSDNASIRITAEYNDAYEFTALPVVACIKQFIAEKDKRLGLWHRALYVEPKAFWEQLQKMGVKVKYDIRK